MADIYSEQFALMAGDLYFDILDDSDNTTGEIDIGEVTVFNAGAPSIEKKEATGHRRSNFGTIIKSLITNTTQEFSITGKDVNRNNLRFAMLGTDAAYTQTAGDNTASPENVVAADEKWVKMSKRNLDPENPPVVKDATDTTTYVEDTDYYIDYQVGRLYTIPDGAIDDGDTLHVGNTWLGHTGFTVSAMQDLQINVQARLIFQDQANNRDGELIIYKGKVEPNGDIGWITDDYAEIGLKITPQDKNGSTWDVIWYASA